MGKTIIRGTAPKDDPIYTGGATIFSPQKFKPYSPPPLKPSAGHDDEHGDPKAHDKANPPQDGQG